MTEETISPAEINDLRRRIANGREWTEDEVRKAIAQIRSQRQASGDTYNANKKKSPGKKKSSPVDLSDLTGDM